jgi:hypothetical protein
VLSTRGGDPSDVIPKSNACGRKGAGTRSHHARWFEGLLAELHFELWVGDAAEIRTRRVRKQKTDRQDAQLILKLMLKDDFPQIWVASWENRDLRQLLWHRHRMVRAYGCSAGLAPRSQLPRHRSEGELERRLERAVPEQVVEVQLPKPVSTESATRRASSARVMLPSSIALLFSAACSLI